MDSINFIKLMSALAYPVGLMMSLFVLALISRWRARPAWSSFYSLCFCLVFFVFSNPVVATRLAGVLENQFPQQALGQISSHDAIIVLGGGLRIPSAPAQHPQLGAAADRYWYATKLFKAGKAKRIFIAGGNVFAQPNLVGEAVYARTLLQEWGVPERAITLEAQSRNTEQNKNNIAALLKRYEIRSALLVTSALHMPRAYQLFKGLPMRITPASADVLIRMEQQPAWKNWIPSAQALLINTKALHEIYGLGFYRLKQLFDDRP